MLAGLAAAEDATLIKPNRRMAVIDTPRIHALVPADQAEELRSKVLRADAIYAHLAADAGYTITEPLTLWLSDDADDHNGFSTVVPRALVQIELAPSLPRSGIFSGDDEFVRTLTHELTHHISNDRAFGFHRVMANLFGRVFPSEYFSLITGYLTVPPHVTMPLFWHEGVAQWAETAYADPTSPWAGRGRDSLTHLVWRLDAESGAIPTADDWRATYTRWPFGNRVYLYGLAYTRWLDGAFRDRASLWRIMEWQAHTWPFSFDGVPISLLGLSHARLIAQARADLQREQDAILTILRSVPPTQLARLTPEDTLVAAPAWLPDGRVLTAFSDPWDTSRLVAVDAAGTLDWTSAPSYDRGEMRGLPDGTITYAEALGSAGDAWARSRIVLRWPDGGQDTLDGERLLQPDLRRSAGAVRADARPATSIVAVQLLPAGEQCLVQATWNHDLNRGRTSPWKPLSTQGRPWHPTYRPGHDDLAWVETDREGSRLVVAPLTDPTQRTILATVRGRLIHPVWTADGSAVFVCADHTGVPNAYRIEVDKPGTLVPVTHVTGAVTACVPSPNGRELALVAFDRHGPYLARIANDPASFPASVPNITLAWPAPVSGVGTAAIATAAGTPAPNITTASATAWNARVAPGPVMAPTPAPAPPADVGPATVRGYWGLRELRFLFWTPTTLATPLGGLGIQALAADPLYTHQVVAAVGVGPVEGVGVGAASYTWSPYSIGLQAAVWRGEATYSDQVYNTELRAFDYTETQTTTEATAGYHLLGSERSLRLSATLGQTSYHAVSASTARYADQSIISTAPFVGRERYVEAAVGWSDTSAYPTSYAAEDGPSIVGRFRQSGLDGDLYRKRATVAGSYAWSLFKRLGHQVVGAGWIGWSDPDGATTLQGAFNIGGSDNALSPRGYNVRIVSGYYSLGYSAAYRMPLWRPFANFGTTPFGFRQLVLEPFFDGGQVSSDRIHGNGDWYRSAGGELAAEWEVWALRLIPVIGVARQLDGAEDTVSYLRLGFQW